MSILIHKNINKKSFLFLTLFLVCMLSSVFNSISVINLSPVIIAIIYTLSFCALNDRYRSLLYLSLIPVSNSTILYYLHAMMLGFTVLSWLTSKERFTLKIRQIDIAFIFAMSYVAIREILVVHYAFSSYITMMGLIACLVNIYLLSCKYKDDTGFVKTALIFWSVSTIALAVNMSILQLNVGGFSNGDTRLGSPVVLQSYNRNDILWQDPNYLGIYIIVAIMGMCITLKKFKNRTLPVAIICGLLICGLATASRGFLMSLCIMLIFFWASANSRKRIKYMMILPFLALGVMFMISSIGIGNYIYNTYSDRFSESDISNGRLLLYDKYSHLLMSDTSRTLFGIGLVNYPSRASVIAGEKLLMVHNSVLEVLVVWGILGFMILLIFIFICYKQIFHSINKIRIKILSVMPFLLFIVPTLTLTVFYSYYSIIPVLFFVVTATLSIKNAERSEL